MAKAWVTDMQVQVIDRCVQLFGGYGYMMEYPIARMFIDSRAQKIYAGANEVMKELIALPVAPDRRSRSNNVSNPVAASALST